MRLTVAAAGSGGELNAATHLLVRPRTGTLEICTHASLWLAWPRHVGLDWIGLVIGFVGADANLVYDLVWGQAKRAVSPMPYRPMSIPVLRPDER